MSRRATPREIREYYRRKHCIVFVDADGLVLFRRPEAVQWTRGFDVRDYIIDNNQRVIVRSWA
jgi:hypothetical protein